MRIKIQHIILISFLTFSVFAQESLDTNYAYLVKTEIITHLHANNGSLIVNTDKGGGGRADYFAHQETVGKTYFDFMELPPNFNSVTVKADNYAIGLGQNSQWQDCDYVEEIIIKKQDFNSKGYRDFGGCSFVQTVYPIHIIGTSNVDNICIKDTISLEGGYDWEYKIGNNGWVNLASAQRKMDIKVNDLYTNIPPITSVNDPNKSLKIRTGYKGKYTDTVTYTIIDCSPEFKGYYQVTKPRCSYESDGGFSIKLGRDLDNEILIVSLYDANFTNKIIGQEYTDQRLLRLDANNYVYKWKGHVDSGRYFVKYQTLNKSGSIPNTNDPSWDSLIPTPIFTIEDTTPLTFEIEVYQDEFCYQSGDGKIRIFNVNGQSNTFEYKIDRIDQSGNIVQPIRDWTIFTCKDFTIQLVNKIGKGTYKVQVRDEKKCYAKN